MILTVVVKVVVHSAKEAGNLLLLIKNLSLCGEFFIFSCFILKIYLQCILKLMIIDSTVLKTLRVLGTCIVFFALLFIAYSIRLVIVWLAIGTFLAIIINPAVSRITAFLPGKKRAWSVAVVFVAGFLIVSVMAGLFIPPLAKQGAALVENWPKTTERIVYNIEKSNEAPYRFIRNNGLLGYVQNNKEDIRDWITNFFGTSVKKIVGSLSSIGAVFTIIAMMMYMAVNGPNYVKAIKKSLPRQHHRDLELLGGKMYTAVTGYVNGNLVTSLIAGVTSGLVSALLGLPYPALLGLIVAFTDLIPMVGATIGAAIVIVVAMFGSLTDALIMLVFFVIYQQLENYVLIPRIMGRTVEMSSFAVFIAALTGGVLAGVIGALVAIPIGACIKIIIDYSLEKWPEYSQKKSS